ncbi:MAG: PhoH family protein [Symbiobacteriaceae bacterium]|nr:PhoH family protein [Symbiobacteriaceae bacterium]
MSEITKKKLVLQDAQEALKLFGHHEEHLRYIREILEIEAYARGTELLLSGPPEKVDLAERLMQNLLVYIRQGSHLGSREIVYALRMAVAGELEGLAALFGEVVYATYRGKQIRPKTLGQKQYLDALKSDDIVFGIGPAGTGKTYLAMAMALAAFKEKRVQRLILCRPAVEAGERLGFLPGDLQEKVDPYLRPLYDALYDMIGIELFQRYLEKRVIEVAPLAYMRGRTLDDAFIILDEAQNTTSEQMKMFLTRMGFGSKVVVTGDITQIDLPHGTPSGLLEARKILQDVPGIGIVYLTDRDVVRHQLVQKVILAYEKFDSSRQSS